MPRHHRRKTTRQINEDCMQLAVKDIFAGIETPSTAARKYGLKRTTIIYRVEKKQRIDRIQTNNTDSKLLPQPLLAEIFTEKQEKELMEYLNRYTYLPYDTSGSYKAARQLVYQFVKEHEIKHPKTWDIEQQAGVDWLKGFIQRNPQTNLRKTLSDKLTDDVDDDSLSIPEKGLPCETQIIETECDVTPIEDLSLNSTQNEVALSLKSPKSETSHTNSFSTLHENNRLQLKNNIHESSNDGVNDECEIELEPECDIIFPMVNILQDSESVPTTHSVFESKAHIPNLDTVPEDDDIFNSFGRNIAFQVKELFQIDKIDALELMHEVQATVHRRLIQRLKSTRNKVNRQNNTSSKGNRNLIKQNHIK